MVLVLLCFFVLVFVFLVAEFDSAMMMESTSPILPALTSLNSDVGRLNFGPSAYARPLKVQDRAAIPINTIALLYPYSFMSTPGMNCEL